MAGAFSGAQAAPKSLFGRLFGGLVEILPINSPKSFLSGPSSGDLPAANTNTAGIVENALKRIPRVSEEELSKRRIARLTAEHFAYKYLIQLGIGSLHKDYLHYRRLLANRISRDFYLSGKTVYNVHELMQILGSSDE